MKSETFKDILIILIIMLAITTFIISLISIGIFYEWKAYKDITNSKISYSDYFWVQPSINNVQFIKKEKENVK